MKKILGLVIMALVAAPTLGACASNEGGTCTTDNDCGSQLSCQLVTGHGERCCPTPPESSDHSSCHPTTDDSNINEPVVNSTPDSGI